MSLKRRIEEAVCEKLNESPPPGLNFKGGHTFIDDRFERWVAGIVLAQVKEQIRLYKEKRKKGG